MEKEKAQKIPFLDLEDAFSATECLEKTGFCVVVVKDSDPLFLDVGEKLVIGGEFSGKRYLTTVVASHFAERLDRRYFIVRSCLEPPPPDSVLKNRAERLHNHAVKNRLTGSPFYSMQF